TNRGSPSISSELSEREMEILKDVALGMSNKEIAEKNYISPHTVITHRKNITRKLGIKTVSGLTIYAIINKLIGMDEVK
ncbi:MAG: LuxR C-terminal-related transcriptional regulator, partial [Perlabentimonas sp.]